MITDMDKTCTKCGETKSATTEYFCFSSHNKMGLSPRCKACAKKYRDSHKDVAKAYSKEYRRKNHESLLLAKKKYYNDNKERIHLEQRAWRIAHKEKRANYDREYASTHKEKIAKYLRAYAKDNREKVRAHKHKWSANNPIAKNVETQKRLARKRSLPATLTKDQWVAILQSFNNLCAYCGQEKPLQQDHFIALAKGGEYSHDNIVPACAECNQYKNAHDFFEWYPKQEFYSKKRERKILRFLNYKKGKQQLSIEFGGDYYGNIDQQNDYSQLQKNCE